MKEKYNIGIIGCGHIAKGFHLPALIKNKNFRLLSAYDPVKKNSTK